MHIDHLLLLIGTNPLPNYVVSQYFFSLLAPPKSVTAIYSQDTFHIAKRLELVLKKRLNHFDYHYCCITDPGDAVKIHYELRTQFDIHEGETYHLNYTGGTKTMAVQIYFSLLEKFPSNERHRVSFSYLDAHDFKLKFDDGSVISEDLRKKIVIKITDLLDLHDCTLPEEKPGEERDFEVPDWSKANAVIRKFITEGVITDFVEWKNDKIRTKFYDTKGKLRKPETITLQELKEDTEGRIRSFPPPDHPFHAKAMELIAAFPERQAWKFDEVGNLQIHDSNSKYREKRGDFVQSILYLDGFWLEKYVIEVLFDEIDKEEGDFEFRFTPNLHIKKGKAQKDFEIDMLILNGYQLCGISMTTSLREAECKYKAFEILHRSQQIGGEEARAVLITPLDELTVNRIQDDLRVDTGGQEQLRILGAAHLPAEKLWQEIKSHILGG